MPLTREILNAFARDIRRLAGRPEPSLYPSYKTLLEHAYPAEFHVDVNLRAPTGGFPDLTVSRGPRLVNWFEVKGPVVHVDPLPHEDAVRFDRYSRVLPHIVLTNGHVWILYRSGVEASRVRVSAEWLLGSSPLSAQDETALNAFLALVTRLGPVNATTYDDAVGLLAFSARLINHAVMDSAVAGLPTRLAQARLSFTDLLKTNPADPADIALGTFADALAQTCTFGYLLARVEAGVDVDPYTAVEALSTEEHPFLKATLHAVIEPDAELERSLKGPLRTACDAVNAAAPVLGEDGRPWAHVPYVYEPFFALYRPEDRLRFGVFYTDEHITRFQVREIQRILRSQLGRSGLTDPEVRFLDPACGTGTYLLALAEEAKREAENSGLPIPATLSEMFRGRVVGFEVAPGPACVAQARLSAWLRSNGVSLRTRFPVYVVNSLTPPAARGAVGSPSLWAESISREQAAGDNVKRDRPVIVVFGNPPWGDRPRGTFQFGPDRDMNWISDWARGASGAVINLYDLYVAFWRLASELLLERPGVQPSIGIASYITNRSWLRGKAFSSMRQWLRAKDASASIVDLGGDIRAGARRDDEPVFAIQAGSAVATLSFGRVDGASPGLLFRRVRGTRLEKLERLGADALGEPALVAGSAGDPFAPVDWGVLGGSEPITKFFAAHYPGVKTHRDELVVDVDREALLRRLRDWNSLPSGERSELFRPSASRVAPPPQYTVDERRVILHRYRPLDDRYLYFDRLFIDRPGTVSRVYERHPGTISLLTMDIRTTVGPVIIATSTLPGYNSFRGSYETHAFVASLSSGARAWAARLGASEQQVAAYLLALGNARIYAATFSEALETDIVRFPATTNGQLFHRAAVLGARILDAWLLQVAPMGTWMQAATGEVLGSATLESDRVVFENGDSLFGIRAAIWEFSVSGYPVLSRYLEARSHRPLTVDLSEAVRRVVGSVSVLLDTQDECSYLLSRAIESSCMPL